MRSGHNREKGVGMKHRVRLIALAAVAILIAAGCGSSSSSSSSSSSASGAGSSSTATATPATTTSGGGGAPSPASLGTPHKATGSPYVFGVINLESGPVTFPEVREAEQAGVDYVNNYLNGINGHPIQLATCVSDGQPATSTNCANQIAGKHPLLILGAADTGSPGSFTVWNRDGLAYIGGAPFTPVESNAKNAAIFISLTVADNAAAIQYAKDTYNVKKASVIYVDDTQGTYTAEIIENEMKNAGFSIKAVPSPNAGQPAARRPRRRYQRCRTVVYDETPEPVPGGAEGAQVGRLQRAHRRHRSLHLPAGARLGRFGGEWADLRPAVLLGGFWPAGREPRAVDPGQICAEEHRASTARPCRLGAR